MRAMTMCPRSVAGPRRWCLEGLGERARDGGVGRGCGGKSSEGREGGGTVYRESSRVRIAAARSTARSSMGVSRALLHTGGPGRLEPIILLLFPSDSLLFLFALTRTLLTSVSAKYKLALQCGLATNQLRLLPAAQHLQASIAGSATVTAVCPVGDTASFELRPEPISLHDSLPVKLPYHMLCNVKCPENRQHRCPWFLSAVRNEKPWKNRPSGVAARLGSSYASGIITVYSMHIN
ncbi:hypothetical protein PYCCODRAFT_358581 [Trametes coccinea BRFM310]|uniref:Uncharacterized protein n=1 Tax=Trametes coccinea (strain BRFM310) TaxID=1353009 RepID=A0A1Y2J6J9_TRAC3|nr:hypothetical protein PYCCODRAFT_358581 [Trametes coccinea BRFM310]